MAAEDDVGRLRPASASPGPGGQPCADEAHCHGRLRGPAAASAPAATVAAATAVAGVAAAPAASHYSWPSWRGPTCAGDSRYGDALATHSPSTAGAEQQHNAVTGANSTLDTPSGNEHTASVAAWPSRHPNDTGETRSRDCNC